MCDNAVLLEQKEKYERKYGCPYCDIKAPKGLLIDHINKEHEELIPKDYTAARIVFNKINKKEHGTCIVCKGTSKWNNSANRYDRICSPRCTNIYKKEIIDKRMVSKYGKTNLLSDPEHQKKMLEGRKISGKYKFKDGGIRTYTGSYEKSLLEFMDKILEIPSKDILTPGPVIYYEFEGSKLAWITDMLYIPFNLVFDVKDGGSNKNTHPDMQQYRDKQIEKEKAIVKDREYNYIRLTDNNFEQLLEIMMDIKMSLLDESDLKNDPIVHINESMISGIHSAPIGPVVYLMPYSRNNVGIEGIGMVKNTMMNNLFIFDDEYNKIDIKNKDFLADKYYSLIPVSPNNIKDKYVSILKDIKENTFIDDLDYFPNMLLENTDNIFNEINQLIYSGYGVSPELLFESRMNNIDNRLESLQEKTYNNLQEIDANYITYANASRFVEGYVDPRDDNDYDLVELEKGIDIETEHVSDKYYSKIIAKDHLDKDLNYYKKLIKMEDENELKVSTKSKNTSQINKLYLSRLSEDESDTRPDSDYSNFELTVGTSIEFEHTHSKDVARVIAKDHLDELPDYYSLMLEYDLIDINRDINIKDMESPKDIKINNSLIDTLIQHKDSIIEKFDFTEVDDIYIGENTMTEDLVPIYVLLTDTGSRMANIIKKVTKSSFNHVSLSFDSSLSKLYSFGVGDNNKKMSFAIESKDKSYIERHGNVNSQLLVVLINKHDANKMKFKLDEFLVKKDKLSYNWAGLIGYIIGKPIEITNKMFCSEFVDNMFKYVGIDLTNRQSGLVSPSDFSKSMNNRIYKVYEGELKNYTPRRIANNVKSATLDYVNKKYNIVKEAASFPIQFDKEGNLLIKNYKKMDFEQEYGKSHKLLLSYDKHKNYEGIKYELSKLWFINSIVESKLYDKNTSTVMKKDFINYRARVLNDFNKYLKVVSIAEPDFNFTKYYNSTPFGDTEIFISKHTVSGVLNIIKGLLA